MTTLTPITAVIPNFTVTPVINTPTFPEDIDQYNTEMPAVIAAQQLTTDQVNVLIPQLNALETNVTDMEALASASALSASGSANFKGVWRSATAYTTGQSVYLSGVGFVVAVTENTNKSPAIATNIYSASNPTGVWLPNVALGSVGNIQSPIFSMSLQNSITPEIGVGYSTFTRDSTATYLDQFGVRKIAVIDEPRKSPRYLNERASTNLVLHSADLSNARWVKVNGTGVKDAVGRDGLSNSASTFTSTSTDATALQTITLASAERTFSIALKRKTGTGQVWITQDGGTTWTDITTSINSTKYTSVSVKQTVLNPVIGIKLNVSGDAVYVDEAQLEALPFQTSYIPTTTVTVPRSADRLRFTLAGNIPNVQDNPKGFTIMLDFEAFGGISGLSQFLLSLGGNTSNDAFTISLFTTTSIRIYIYNSIASVVHIWGSQPLSGRIAVTVSNSSLKSYLDGVLFDSDTNTTGKITETGNTQSDIYIGGWQGSTAYNFCGYITNVKIYADPLSDQEIVMA